MQHLNRERTVPNLTRTSFRISPHLPRTSPKYPLNLLLNLPLATIMHNDHATKIQPQSKIQLDSNGHPYVQTCCPRRPAKMLHDARGFVRTDLHRCFTMLVLLLAPISMYASSLLVVLFAPTSIDVSSMLVVFVGVRELWSFFACVYVFFRGILRVCYLLLYLSMDLGLFLHVVPPEVFRTTIDVR